MESESQFWTCIPVSEFGVPSPPASDAARGAALRLWKSFQKMFRQPKKMAMAEQHQLDRPLPDLLRSMSPDPDWNQAAEHLANALEDDWFEDRDPARRIYAFVAPPGIDMASALRRLAQDRQLNVIDAPTPDSILAPSTSKPSVIDALEESNAEILVIPNLERWYLRHEDGLSVVRRLVEQLIIRRKRVLLACDSWAWAFLQQTVGIADMLGDAKTFAPFDAQRLNGWFRSTFDLQGHEFRQSGSDRLIFPDLSDDDHEQAERPTVIGSLAAEARGNLAVALALWRACLRTRDGDGATDAPAPPVSSGKSALWVVAPNDLASSQLPFDADRLHHFILHAVLLHRGLSLSSMERMLPFSRDDIQKRVSALRWARVLEEQDERLRVTLTAYPLVRRELQNEGFLTDAF